MSAGSRHTRRITARLVPRGNGSGGVGRVAIGNPTAAYEFVDRMCLRDADGKAFVPGTTLAGVLAGLARTALRARGIDHTKSVAFKALFGEAPGASGTYGQEARLTVRDARPCGSATSTSLIRDRNAVDRKHGAAADQRLFKEEALYVTGFDFEVEFSETGPRTPDEQQMVVEHGRDPDAEAWRLLLDAVDLMTHGWVSVGGQFGVGAGRICVEDTKVFTWDRRDPDQVHAFATQRWNAFEPTDFAVCVSAAKASLPAGSQWLADAASCSGRPPERLRLTCRVRPEQPLLVKAGYTSEMRAAVGSRWPAPGGLSGVPLLKERDGKLTQFAVDAAFPLDPQGRPFVPGSSVRGVIRTRAERVSRTVADASRKAWDLDDLQQHAKDLRGRRNWLEAVEVPCLVTQVFGFERLGGRIGFTDAVPVDPMAFEDRRKLLDHVAIDRFTGGAADQRKFNERPYVPRKDDAGSADDKGDLTCEIELFDFEERHLGLLLLLLRDLALGRVQFGANRNDGMGRLVLVSVEATALTARGGLLWTEGATEREVAGLSEVDTSMDCPRPDGYLTDTKRLWADVFRRAEQACRTYLATPTAATPAQGEADDAG